MIPAWSLLFVPAIVLSISRAWSGDWMREQPGARRWVRLTLLTIGPFGLLMVTYIGYRAWSVPDLGPLAGLEAIRSHEVPPEENAADLYRTAIEALRPPLVSMSPATSAQVDRAIDVGWQAATNEVVEWWRDNRPALDLVRKAAGRPRAQFDRI